MIRHMFRVVLRFVKNFRDVIFLSVSYNTVKVLWIHERSSIKGTEGFQKKERGQFPRLINE